MTALEKKMAKALIELADFIIGLHPDAEKPLKKVKEVLGEVAA